MIIGARGASPGCQDSIIDEPSIFQDATNHLSVVGMNLDTQGPFMPRSVYLSSVKHGMLSCILESTLLQPFSQKEVKKSQN